MLEGDKLNVPDFIDAIVHKDGHWFTLGHNHQKWLLQDADNSHDQPEIFMELGRDQSGFFFKVSLAENFYFRGESVYFQTMLRVEGIVSCFELWSDI